MVLGERGCEQSFLDAAAIGCRMKGLVYAATLFPAGSVGLEKKTWSTRRKLKTRMRSSIARDSVALHF